MKIIRLKTSTLLAAFLMVTCLAFGQNRSALERAKKQLSEKIKNINELLSKSKSEANNELDQLNILSAKIDARSQLLNAIQKEVRLVNQEIVSKNLELNTLQKDLEALKENYAQLIRQSFLLKSQQNNVLFILSSNTFYQAYARLQYLDSFAKFRKEQGENILKKEVELDAEIEKLERIKSEKIKLLQFQKEENAKLKVEQDEQKLKLDALRKQQKQLEKDLKKQQAEQKAIALAIKELIEKELAASNKSTGGSFKLTPEALKLSNDFSANYGKLPWPVEKGVITGKFGKQPHPILSGVTIENNGINISTEKGAAVRSVFSGTVSSIILIPGLGKGVVINHGAYRTVYTNLKEVFVSKGQAVDTKQFLGTVVERNGKNEAHLEIWKISSKGSEKLNPSKWLYQ